MEREHNHMRRADAADATTTRSTDPHENEPYFVTTIGRQTIGESASVVLVQHLLFDDDSLGLPYLGLFLTVFENSLKKVSCYCEFYAFYYVIPCAKM